MKKSERETVITWTADEERATVYSLMPRVWKMCERAGGEEIEREGGVRDGQKIARTFLVDVRLIRIRRPRKMTAKEAATRAEIGAKNLAAARRAKAAKKSPAPAFKRTRT